MVADPPLTDASQSVRWSADVADERTQDGLFDL